MGIFLAQISIQTRTWLKKNVLKEKIKSSLQSLATWRPLELVGAEGDRPEFIKAG